MKYIVAVSGGVDSVVLLDMLVNNELDFDVDAEFVVAHFDHGIRDESSEDAAFVEQLAKQYNLQFELGSARLGAGASEDTARKERYNFLQKSRKKYSAPSIILAHHEDDVIETAIINITRGTGWRGLSSLGSSDELTRPLLHITKTDLTDYAKRHSLHWVEDNTNSDQTYLRNYIRHTVIPLVVQEDATFTTKLLHHIDQIKQVKQEIDRELDAVIDRHKVDNCSYIFSRYIILNWPNEVSSAIVHRTLSELDDDWHPTSQHITRVIHFAKTARPGKVLDVSKTLQIVSTQRHIEFKKY